MENYESAADASIAEPHSRKEFLSKPLSVGLQEEERRLMRAFSDIKNPAVRNIILDMVSALAWQDSQVRPPLVPSRSLNDQ